MLLDVNDPFWQTTITIVSSVIASGGFWTLIQSKMAKLSSSEKLLMGIAQYRIIALAEHCIEKGYITYDEYETLNDHLYIPYKENGGNGAAEKMMDEVKKLPIRHDEEK